MRSSSLLAAILVVCHAAVASGTANLCLSGLQASQQICGTATGNFQLMGSLCFGASTQSSVTISIAFKNVGTTLPLSDLNQYYVYFYDDQLDSFALVNRISDSGDGKNCSENGAFSKSICTTTSCNPGWQVVTGSKSTDSSTSITTYSKTVSITESYAREWYFVLAACSLSTPVQLQSYSISSDTAVDCQGLYSFDDGGYVAAVVLLTLACAGLVVTAYTFWKRTKIPDQLMSMVRARDVTELLPTPPAGQFLGRWLVVLGGSWVVPGWGLGVLAGWLQLSWAPGGKPWCQSVAWQGRRIALHLTHAVTVPPLPSSQDDSGYNEL